MGRINPGALIRLNKLHKWEGCIAIVDEVKHWGVQAYIATPTGDAYIRLKEQEFDIVFNPFKPKSQFVIFKEIEVSEPETIFWNANDMWVGHLRGATVYNKRPMYIPEGGMVLELVRTEGVFKNEL